MDGWMDKTDCNAYTSYGTKEFAKLFECMFNIILAISKNILHLMIPPIQLFMVIIFFSYTLALKATHEALDHNGSPLVIHKHVYNISGLFTSWYIFSIIHSNKCMWVLHSFDKGIST